MNEQMRFAQATGAGQSNSTPARIFKLTKPFADQAVVVNVGYDQKVQVDFSAIANEKITLVHLGEKLIILFDNQSTVTVEPFFDSRHDQLGNLSIEVAPGRDLTVAEFASAFPIISDPSAASSVLPAAGDTLGQNNAQASGANFSPFTVDTLPPVPTNTLAGPEELPGFETTQPTGTAPQTITPPAPTISAGIVPDLVVDESFLTVATNGIPGSGEGPFGVTVATGVVPFTLNVPGGQQSLTFALSISAAGVDSGLIDSQTGNHVFLFVENGVVVGREGANAGAAAGGHQDFTLSVDANGKLTLTDLRSVHEGTGEAGDINEGTHLPAGLVALTATVTDNSNQTSSASVDVGPHLTILDDGPVVTLTGNIASLNTDESYIAASTNGGVAGSTPDLVPTQGHALDTESFAGAFAPVTGADGGATTYALSIAGNGTATNLTDSVSGLNVVLDQSGNTVSGYVAGHENQAGWLVFTLTVDPSTGSVTLTQDRAVHEGTASSPDSSEGIGLTSGLVTLTATVTDNDGDTASQSIDLGSHATFHDDGPTISLADVRTPALNVDESYIPVIGSGTGAPGSATDTESFAGAFSHVDGADGASIGYALSVSSAGVDSGLIDSVSGNHIYLFVNGAGAVEGREGATSALAAGGPIDFTLSVDGSGNVTAVVERGVKEGSADTPTDISEGVSLASGLVTLTATITDGDGDHQAASIDLGSQLTIHDDGPKAPTVALGTATVGVDETPGIQTTGGASDVAGSTAITFNSASTTVAALFATVASKGVDSDVATASLDNGAISFASTGAGSMVSVGTLTYGADGPAASNPEQFALSILNASPTGLKLTDGTAITLSLDASGRVIGTVGTDTVNPTLSHETAFAIAIDPVTGQLYVAQYLSLQQDSLTNTPNDVFTLPAGTIGVTVSLTDGDGDKVTTAATDVSTHVSFLDDGPTNIIPDMAVLLNAPGKTFTGALDVDSNVQDNFGADGGTLKFAASLNNTDSGLTSGGQHIFYSVSADGHTLTGYLDSNADHTFDAGDATVFTIALNLDSSVNVSNDTFTMTMASTVDGGAQTISFSGAGVNFLGGNHPWTGFTLAGGNDLLLTPETNGVPAGNVQTDANAGGINSGNSMGLGDTMVLDFVTNLGGDPTKNVSSNDYNQVANRDYTFDGHYTVNGAFATFTSSNGSEARLTAWDYNTSIGHTTPGVNDVPSGTEDSITQIAISYNNAQLFITEASIGLNTPTNYVVGGHTFTVDFVSNGGHIEALVDGIVGNSFAAGAPFTQVAAYTASGYQELQVSYDNFNMNNIAGSDQSFNTFKIGDFGATVVTPGSPVDLSVPLTITDGDGDTAAGAINAFLMPAAPTTQDFSSSGSGVTATASATQPDIMGSAFGDTLNGDANNNILYGGAGDDTLVGGGGNDTLIGGAGTNTLTGGTGADSFVIQSVKGLANGGEYDNIVDFSSAQNDQIFVNVGGGHTLSNAPSISSLASVTDATQSAAWNGTANQFAFNTTHNDLWFSADGTAAHAVDLAHIATGIPPAANVHAV